MLKNKIIDPICDSKYCMKESPHEGPIIFAIFIILTATIIFYSLSCVSPGAVKTEAIAKIASIEDNLNKLEKIVDNNIENVDTLKEQLVEINKTINNSGVINYSGSWAVIVGMSSITIIFLLSIFLSIKYYFKANKNTNLLSLVTTAVKNSNPKISDGIKAQITKETSNGGKFNIQHKKQLATFIKNN